jgi:glycosyltransferase involved in cell wall biosynthesis
MNAARTRRRPPTACFAVAYFPKYLPAGAEIQSYFISQHMLSRGWSVHFTSDDCGQPTPQLHNEDGIWVHKLKRTRLLNPFRCWSFYRELLRMNADIYYQRGGTEYTLITSLVARTLRRKFVWAASSDIDCQTDGFRRILRTEAATGIKRAILWLDARVRDAMVSLGRKGADVIVVQGESQKQRMKEEFGRESVVIKSGHPVPKGLVQKKHPPTAVWISNIKRLKHPETFIELVRECTDVPGRFLLVGGGTSPLYLDRLKRLSHGLSNLEWVGAVPFWQTNELLAEASVLVNTSAFEGFPNTFVQAWLRETPVVSLTVDPDGILQRERIGFCSQTFPRMVRDVRRLLSDQSLRSAMGKRARIYAEREHDLSDKVQQYAALFEALYSEGGVV